MNESDQARRRRWINLGEIIALAALIVSAAGVWIAWRGTSDDKPTHVAEQRSAVPLALRGVVDSDQRALTIVPADPSHALESLTVTAGAASPIETGGNGRLAAGELEPALKGRDKEAKDVAHSLPLRIDARYVEAGADRRSSGRYVLRYKWEGGGLFGGRSLRLVSLSKG